MADAWELPDDSDPPGIISGSDSDSESSSSSAPSSGASTSATEFVPRPCPARDAERPGRGRPRGQGGTRAERARHDRFLAARGILPDEAPPALAPCSIVAVLVPRFGYDVVPCNAVYHGCAAVALILGQRIAGALVALPSSAVDADALAVAGYVCGDEPVPTLGARGLVTGFGCRAITAGSGENFGDSALHLCIAHLQWQTPFLVTSSTTLSGV